MFFQSVSQRPESSSSALDSIAFLNPPSHAGYVFFDAAISTARNCAGFGIFVRNPHGAFQFAMAKKLPGILDPGLAESCALREAVCLARNLHLKHCTIAGDAAQIVLSAKGLEDGRVCCCSIIQEASDVLNSFDTPGVFWASRDMAHILPIRAKNSFSLEDIWWSPSPFLYQSSLDTFQQS